MKTIVPDYTFEINANMPCFYTDYKTLEKCICSAEEVNRTIKMAVSTNPYLPVYLRKMTLNQICYFLVKEIGDDKITLATNKLVMWLLSVFEIKALFLLNEYFECIYENNDNLFDFDSLCENKDSFVRHHCRHGTNFPADWRTGLFYEGLVYILRHWSKIYLFDEETISKIEIWLNGGTVE